MFPNHWLSWGGSPPAPNFSQVVSVSTQSRTGQNQNMENVVGQENFSWFSSIIYFQECQAIYITIQIKRGRGDELRKTSSEGGKRFIKSKPQSHLLVSYLALLGIWIPRLDPVSMGHFKSRSRTEFCGFSLCLDKSNLQYS